MVARISIYLVFALVILPYYSVLCQEDAWQSVIDGAKQTGIPQETLDGAQSALGDASIQQAAGPGGALDDGSLADWVQQADAETKEGSIPAAAVEAPADLPDEIEEDIMNSPIEAPKLAPNFGPVEAPDFTSTNAPVNAPQLTPSPEFPRKYAYPKAPSPAPQAHSPYAASPQA